MAHFLDPKHDLTFKRVFGEHKHLCISLINSMLPLKNPVVDIEYQSGELIPPLDILRNTIVDVRCIDSDGRQFLVEMQLFWYSSFKKRVLLNASKAYVTQSETAQKLSLLQPVYSLNFVNETFENSKKMQGVYFHHYKIVNIENTEKRIEGLEFVFIELPKFIPQNRVEKKLHELWLRFLAEINESTETIPQALLDNDLTCEAASYVEKAAYTKEELAKYDKWKIDLLSAQSMLDDAEMKGLEKGEAIGLEKGEAIGLEKGLEKGKAERDHLKTELKTAQKLQENVIINSRRSGLPLETISSITGLTPKQVIEILKQNGLE
jgi:predicted transposase/invertase (TIGR01784 family)